MKLKELIQKLQELSVKYDQNYKPYDDYEIVAFDDRGTYGSLENVEVDEQNNEILIY